MTLPFLRKHTNAAAADVHNAADKHAAYVNARCKAVLSNFSFYAAFALDIVFFAIILHAGYTLLLQSFFGTAFVLECITVLFLLPVPLLQVGIVKRNAVRCAVFSAATVIQTVWAFYIASYGGLGPFGLLAAARALLWLCAFFVCRVGVGSVFVAAAGVLLALLSLLGANALFGFSFAARPLRFTYVQADGTHGAGYAVASVLYGSRDNVKIPAVYRGKPVVAVQTGREEIVCMQTLVLPEHVMYIEIDAPHLRDLTVKADGVRFSENSFYCPNLRKLTFAGNDLPIDLPPNIPVAYAADFVLAVPRDKTDEALARDDFAHVREHLAPAVGENEGYIVYYTDCTLPEGGAPQEVFTQPVTVTQGNGFVALPAPDLSDLGYAFEGWYTDRLYTHRAERVPAAAGTRLYARYYKLYTVSLYADRYAAQPQTSFTYHYASGEVRLPADGVGKKEGYAFCGWFAKSDYTVEAPYTATWSFSSEAMGHRAFYAVYKKEYAVTLYTDGGRVNGDIPSTYHEWSETAGLAPAEKEGHTFMGWYTDPQFDFPIHSLPPIDEDGEVRQSDVDLYAKFNKNYAIAYENAYTLPSNAPKQYHCDSNLKLPTPARQGYRFAGWFDNDAYTGEAMQVTPREKARDLRLYAKWAPVTYTVRYDKGDYWDPTGSVPDSVLTFNEHGALAMCGYEKKGYSFVGWEIDGKIYAEGQEGVFNFASTQGAVVKASAQWRAHEFTLVFVPDCDDAEGAMPAVQCSYLQYYVMPSCTFTREGYRFLFWSIFGSVCREGVGCSLAWEAMQEDGATIEVRAVWEKI